MTPLLKLQQGYFVLIGTIFGTKHFQYNSTKYDSISLNLYYETADNHINITHKLGKF